jgi:hypothetical protein
MKIAHELGRSIETHMLDHAHQFDYGHRRKFFKFLCAKIFDDRTDKLSRDAGGTLPPQNNVRSKFSYGGLPG